MSSTTETRAERLLAAMHKVFAHDLPNQLVVMQSLVGLLSEEADRLSDEGRDHLRRLGAAAGRAGDMVYFLKDMARLSRLAEPMEEVGLAALAREAHAELGRLYPTRELRLETTWQATSIMAGRRSLHQAVVLLLRCGLERLPQKVVRLLFSSQGGPHDVDIGVALEPVAGALVPPSEQKKPDRAAPEQRLEFILARENIATWGGSLSTRADAGGTHQFFIRAPAFEARAP
ncbi:MAG: hypothetical protein U0793_11485 [Gemmataceae bacterium]